MTQSIPFSKFIFLYAHTLVLLLSFIHLSLPLIRSSLTLKKSICFCVVAANFPPSGNYLSLPLSVVVIVLNIVFLMNLKSETLLSITRDEDRGACKRARVL